MTKNKEKEDLITEMDHFIRVIGSKEGNTEEGNSKEKMEKYIKEGTNMVNLKYDSDITYVKNDLFYVFL